MGNHIPDEVAPQAVHENNPRWWKSIPNGVTGTTAGSIVAGILGVIGLLTLPSHDTATYQTMRTIALSITVVGFALSVINTIIWVLIFKPFAKKAS